MSWSALQHETLEAMGFALLRPREASAGVVQGQVESAHAVPESAPTPDARLPSAAPASRRAASVDRTMRDDPLAHALLRAAGRPLGAADGAEWLSQWPDTASLRRDPAAKRALWPRLRALRRGTT